VLSNDIAILQNPVFMGLIRQYHRIESKRGDGVESEAAEVLESFVSLVADLSLFGASVDLNLLLPASVVESAAIKYECSADYLYLCTGFNEDDAGDVSFAFNCGGTSGGAGTEHEEVTHSNFGGSEYRRRRYFSKDLSARFENKGPLSSPRKVSIAARKVIDKVGQKRRKQLGLADSSQSIPLARCLTQLCKTMRLLDATDFIELPGMFVIVVSGVFALCPKHSIESDSGLVGVRFYSAGSSFAWPALHGKDPNKAKSKSQASKHVHERRTSRPAGSVENKLKKPSLELITDTAAYSSTYADLCEKCEKFLIREANDDLTAERSESNADWKILQKRQGPRSLEIAQLMKHKRKDAAPLTRKLSTTSILTPRRTSRDDVSGAHAQITPTTSDTSSGNHKLICIRGCLPMLVSGQQCLDLLLDVSRRGEWDSQLSSARVVCRYPNKNMDIVHLQYAGKLWRLLSLIAKHNAIIFLQCRCGNSCTT
jgi:hypothetical protein